MNAPVKVALCINRANLPTFYNVAYINATKPKVYSIMDSLFDQPTGLMDRAFCETDEDYKQFLPYIVVTNPEYKIFSYYRGGAGEESRLHGAISIGIGGHVDVAPPNPGAAHLKVTLELEAHRELFEEIGVVTKDLIDFTGVIIDPTNAVGRVHLGLLTRVHLTDRDMLTLEDGMIEQGQFRTLTELRQPEIYDRLENWSKAVVDHLSIDPTK